MRGECFSNEERKRNRTEKQGSKQKKINGKAGQEIEGRKKKRKEKRKEKKRKEKKRKEKKRKNLCSSTSHVIYDVAKRPRVFSFLLST